MKRFLQTLILSLCLPFLAAAQEAAQADAAQTGPAGDTIVVSLLTCTPGELVYELYGHTALRVREMRNGVWSDWVFNYGTFSFSQPHFRWRFMLGQTDYQLGVIPYVYFYTEYARAGRGMVEQRINLRPDEAKRVVDALAQNLRPENCTYRYNFFYDNCVTRAVQVVEDAVEGKVVWPEAEAGKTLRDMVNEFSKPSPWNRLGQNLLLGAEADRPADLRKQMFAPVYASRFVETARIVDPDGSERPLALAPVVLLAGQPTAGASAGNAPLWLFGTLLALAVAITLVELRTGRNYWGFDALLLLAQGFTGLIIAFLFCFSEHPAVGSNWLVVAFNPWTLVYLPWFMKAASRRRRPVGMYVQLVLTVATALVGAVGLQEFPAEVYLMLLVLAMRALHALCRPSFRRAASVPDRPAPQSAGEPERQTPKTAPSH